MKNILFIVLLFMANVLFAQGPEIALDIKMTNENTSKKLAGVTVEVYKDGTKISSSTTSSKGMVDVIVVPVGHMYKIKFKKSGFVTKMIEIDGRYDTPEDLEDEIYYPIAGSLFESVEGIDFSFLENSPMLKLAFTPDGYEFEWDKAHYKQMKKKIEELKKKLEKAKLEEEKKEKERVKLEADFQAYVNAGDKAVGSSDFQKAIEQFKLALKLKDDAAVKTKLANAETELANASANAQKDKDYNAKMAEALTAFKAKNFTKSLELYQSASQIKPTEQEPKDQIAEINKLLAKQKEQEAEFNKLVADADSNVSSEKFDLAIDNYTKALKIKNDDAVTAKLENAKKLKIDKENAEKAKADIEANYQNLMLSAKKLFDKEDWQAAKDKYNEALKVKENESLPKTQIQLIDKKIADLKANADKLKQIEEKYLAKMTEAKNAFDSNNYENALKLFNEAKSIDSSKDEPQVQINKINTILKEQSAKEAEFKILVEKGDIALKAELFEDAIQSYKQALKIKDDATVSTKIEDAIKLRDEKTNAANAAKEKEENYQAAIKSADKFYDTENWTDALEKYKEALSIKESEDYPTKRIAAIEQKIADENAKKDAENQAEKEYNTLITEADKLFDSEKLIDARSKYSAALNLKAGEQHPTDRIDLINTKLAKAESDKKLNDKYLAELNKAKALYDQKKYQEALSSYNLAAGIKTDEQEPKDKIAEINKLLNDKKNAVELEKEYQALMTEGKSMLTSKSYATALDRFKKALGVKPNDTDAQSKIDEVNKLIADQKQAADKQAEFDEFVKKGKTNLDAKNYQEAKLNYTKALAIFKDAEVEAKLKEINDLIAKNQSAAEQEKLYNDALNIANDLYDANEYEKALTKYEAVNSIKKTQFVDERINDVKNKLDKLKANKEKEDQFKKLVDEATEFETKEEFAKAIAKLKEAYLVKQDAAVNKKISALELKLESDKKQAAREQAYIDMVGKADAEFKQDNWKQAIDFYTKAKTLKTDETYPDERIKACNAKLNSLVNAELMAKYNAEISKANGLYNTGKFDESLVFYKKASTIKSDEQYPKDRIAEINKNKADKANAIDDSANKEEAYKKLVAKADELLNAKNYADALSKYNEAITQKPKDFYVISKITEVEKLLATDEKLKEKRNKYDKLIAEGDALMNPGTWSEAKTKFESALTLFSTESYPKNQINTCDDMMKNEASSDAEKAYQKILTVAQKKMDAENYDKAISLYERALTMKPTDPKPQAKIDEINQLLKNKNVNAAYNGLISKADNLFEKKKWKDARILYVQAYAIANDSYADDQIKKIDELDFEFNKKQYNKMISKADEYFIDKNYTKSKGLYERAIKFLPNHNNTYPINRIKEIRDILNPPMAVNNGMRNLGEKVIGMTEEEMDAMLADDSEQRKFNEINSVKVITKEMAAEKSEWKTNAKESTDLTKDKSDLVIEELAVKATIAEVKRVKAEKATIEQQKEYQQVQKEKTVYTNAALHRQKVMIENVKDEIAENTMNADIPRREYEKEVVGINVNIKQASNFQSNAQTNQSFDQKKYVDHIQKTHITQDPNNDVARKNTEVKVIDQGIRLSNENSKNAWAQEDAIMKTKNQANNLVNEIRVSNVNNDIPRQNTIDETIEIKERNKEIYIAQSRHQADVRYDVKSYTDKAKEEIRIERIANDIPRQKMELTTVKVQDELATANTGFSTSQKTSINSTKDKIESEIEIQREVFSTKNKEREDDAQNVIVLKEKLELSNKVLSDDNRDVSFATKDYVDKQIGITEELKQKGNTATISNQDKAKDALSKIKKEKDELSEANQEKVNGTVDYLTKMKDEKVVKTKVNSKNKLGEDFPEGVTEEIYEEKDAYGLLVGFVVRRVVVTGGEGNVYEKTKTRHGVASYTKNGEPISQQVWQDNTANANLIQN